MYFFVSLYFDYILLKEKCTKDIYRCLNSNVITHTSINKWNTVLSTYLSNNICVTDVFNVCLKKILNIILPVNFYPKKNNVVTSDECSSCKEDSETIQHVFFICEVMPFGIILVCYFKEELPKELP